MVIAVAIFGDAVHRHLATLVASLKGRVGTVLLVVDVIDNNPFLGSDTVSELAIVALAQEVLITTLVILVLATAILERIAAADGEVGAVSVKRVIRHCSEVQQIISFGNFTSFFTLFL
mgnify:FL=1|jgi:hypothetical protein|tara:strand:- start:1869 stop:2222 length:354 start_codon:yes stop_codon:yes gene_type:complete